MPCASRFRPSPPTLAAAIALLAGQPLALGALLNWSAAGGGSTSLNTNWSPTLVPTSNDDLVFNLSATYTITFNASTVASRTQTYKHGTVTVVASSPHTIGGVSGIGLIVGDANLDNAITTFTTGTVTSLGRAIVGDAAGSTGTLNVNDDDADLLIGAVGGGADLYVASNAPGTLNITGGGLVQVADEFVAGNNSPGTSTLTVSGATNTLPLARSTLRVLGTGVPSSLGQGGDATVNISNGALADFDGDLVVSNGSASISTVTVAGLGGLVPQNATLDVTGHLLLGQNTTAGIAAGTATLTVNADGRVLVGDTLSVGNDPDAGTGTLNINTGGLVEATSVIDGSSGTINHTGGALRINGGTYSGMAVPYSVSGAAANDVTLAWANNASQTLVPAGGVSLIVGDDLGAGVFEGFLRVESGADLDMGNGDLNIGDDAGVTGTVTVTGVGSRLIASSTNSDIRVGFNGTGNIRVESGGQCQFRNLLVPALNNANGFVDCLDDDSTITTQFLAIGHASGSGDGLVQIQLDATLNVTDPGFSTNIRSTGELVVAASGTMATPGTITVESGGTLAVGGTVTNAALVDVNGGTLDSRANSTGTPLVNARVRLRAGSVLDANSEDLTAGDAASTSGFVADLNSTITIGAHTLTLLDADEANVDTVTIAAGTLAAPNGILINTNGSIDGTGTITTPEIFFNSGGGVLTATGAAGITINGTLRNNSGTIDGTKFTFNAGGPNSGWTGAGDIDARAVFNSGTEVNALANMNIGLNVFDGVTFNLGSELHADTRRVTLIDSNGIGLGSVTDVNGGHVVCAQNLVVNNGRRLSGRGGSIDCPTLTINGRLSPGELVGEPVGETGELTINGNLVLQVNADTDIEIQGLIGPIEYDRVVVSGAATLAGNLNVSFISGFVPTQPFALGILQATSFSGSFSAVTLPPRTRLRTTATEIAVVFCPADFNQSGTITVQDIFDFLAGYFGGNPLADFNGSGSISVQDIFDFLAAYFAGCP